MLRSIALSIGVLAAGCDLGEVPGPGGGGPDAPGGSVPDSATSQIACRNEVLGVGDGHHNPGQDCMQAACHAIGGDANAPDWVLSGTLYTDAAGTAPNVGATITIQDSQNT